MSQTERDVRVGEQEKPLSEVISIKEFLRRTQDAIPVLAQASTVGAITRTGLQLIAVDQNYHPGLVTAKADFTSITHTCEMYEATGAYTAQLADDSLLPPNPYALDFILTFNPTVFRVSTKDRARPYRYGIEFASYAPDFETEVTVFAHGKWRMKMEKTQGKYIQSVSFISPLAGEGDVFVTFKNELLRIDKQGLALGKLRQSLIALKGSEREGIHGDVVFFERDNVVKNILRFYDTLGEQYLPADFKRDRRLLTATSGADEFLRAFLEGLVNDSPHKLTRTISDLMSTAIENTALKPNKIALLSASFRFPKEGYPALADIVSGGVDKETEGRFVRKARASTLKNKDNILLLLYYWSNLIEDNIDNYKALIQADINFPKEELEDEV